MTSVAFATPSLNHHVCFEYMASMFGTIGECMKTGVQMRWITRGGDQFIAKVRSKLCEEFLASDSENLFFIDDDVGFPPEKVMEFLNRPEPIIAGAYPKKQETTDWPVVLLGEDGKLQYQDGLVKASMIPMGFTKIHRSVLEELAKQLDAAPPEAPVRFWEREADGEIRMFRGFFNSGIGPDQQWWGEDHAFCRNCMTLGYDVWVDPDVEFTHRGNKLWKGNISASMPTFEERAQLAFQEQQAQALAAAEPDNKEAA